MFRSEHLTYDQSRFVFKEVRKELELKPSKSRNKGTVKRMANAEIEKFQEGAYKLNGDLGLMMRVLYETATRVDEFVNLEVDDIMYDESRIVVKNGKGGKRREIPITEDLRHSLRTFIGEREVGYVFESNRNKKFTTRRIQQLVKDVTEEAEIQVNVTPHMLRHTRATLLAEKGMSKDMLQVFLGHSRPDTTQIYTDTAALDVESSFREATS